MIIQSLKTGKQVTINADDWQAMIDRGDSRKFKVISQSVAPPLEAVQAAEKAIKGPKAKPDTVPADEPDNE